MGQSLANAAMVGAGALQEKRLLRLANKARALTEVYKHASIVVPLALPERLPARVGRVLDAGSQWHVSALLSSAVESVMLPSRMRDPARRETLSGMAEVLNAMGKQSVADLQMSVDRHDSESEERKDARVRELSEEELSEGVQLDMRFTPSDRLEAYSRSNGFHKPRVFSQIISSRGYDDKEGGDIETDEEGRRRRRSAYEPVTQRSVAVIGTHAWPQADSGIAIIRPSSSLSWIASPPISSGATRTRHFQTPSTSLAVCQPTLLCLAG